MQKALHGTTYVFEYIFAVANLVHGENLGKITFDEIHRTIKKVAIATQRAQEIDAGKKWRDYEKKAQEKEFMLEAADKTTTAMVRWGLLERPTRDRTAEERERWYSPNAELRTIGVDLSQKAIRKASLRILDHILTSEKDSALNPQLFIKLRESKTQSEVESKYNLPVQGVSQWSPSYLKYSLDVSQVDFNMITFWCQHIGLLNVFNPKVLDMKLPKEVYLTVWIASGNELSSVYSRVSASDFEIRSNSDLHCTELLKLLGSIQVRNGHAAPLVGSGIDLEENDHVIKSIREPYSPELILIGERRESQGLIHEELKSFDRTYLLYPRQIPTDVFADTLKVHYRNLRSKWRTPYVWISPLRALCCRTLMVSDEYFDNMLTKLYEMNPEKMEFSKAATGFFRTRVRVFEKPFKLYNQPFRMIRMEG